MPKLRTLIQMEVPINDLNCDEYSTELVATSEELRQAAIDWIKEEITIKINERLPAPEKELQLIAFDTLKHPETKRWMKRFNLTKEDLKCVN